MRAERLARALLAIAFCVALWSQVTALAPSRGAAPTFNSDAAIPVLMANDAHWDAFRLYFYGQDRFGAWPFWVAHLLRRSWTPDDLHLWQTLWLFSGVIAAVLLGRRRAVVGGAAFLLAIGLPGLVRQIDADLAQPYAWQLPALLWAWLALRAWVERPGAARAALAVALAFLAIWISTLSAPLLAALALLEQRRVRALLPVAFATAAEASLRQTYHRAALARFQGTFLTHLRLDWGHLADNCVALSHRLLAVDCWPALTAATLGAALAGWALRRRNPRVDPDLGVLTVGLATLALLPLPVLVGVSHVRENLFDERFFTPTLCFAQAAALAAAVLAVELVVPSARVRVERLIAGGTLLLLVVLRPISTPSPQYDRMAKTAAALVELAPGSPLINGYWNSYLYAALVPPATLTALPADGEYGRTPFDLDKLRLSPTVIVGNAGALAAVAGAPALSQYGRRLVFLRPLYSDGTEAFALYQNAGPSQ